MSNMIIPVPTIDIWQSYLQLIARNTGPLIIVTPFLSDRMTQVTLRSAAGASGQILTRGTEDDFLTGVVDCNALRQFINAGWFVKLHKRLHAKVYWRGGEFLFGSCNLTQAGMIGPPAGNWECAAIGKGEISSIFNFGDLWAKATFVTLQDIDNIEKWKVIELEKLRAISRDHFPLKLNQITHSGIFTLNDIPQSASLLEFCRCMQSIESLGILERSTTLHDADLMNDASDFGYDSVCQAFMTLPLVTALLEITGDGQGFGTLRAWLERHVADVPTPSRQDFNQQLNRLYEHIVEASRGKYQREVPGRRSEWLVKKF